MASEQRGATGEAGIAATMSNNPSNQRHQAVPGLTSDKNTASLGHRNQQEAALQPGQAGDSLHPQPHEQVGGAGH
jgi:hypothetical protein